MKVLTTYQIVQFEAREEGETCLEMRDRIFNELQVKGKQELYLADETPEEFLSFFTNQDCFAVGALLDGKLAGCAVASYRQEMLERFMPMAVRGLLKEDNFKNNEVGYIELAQVEASARGFGLQRKMVETLENEFLKKRGAKYSCAIVSPNNGPSLHNLQKLGYEVVEKFKHSVGNYERYKVLKDFAKEPQKR